MKTLIYSMLTILALSTSVYSAEIPYTFQKVDVVIPGQVGPARLYDVNDKGQVLAGGIVDGEFRPILSNGLNGKGTYRPVFNCPGFELNQGLDPETTFKWSEGFAISNSGHVVGYCQAGDESIQTRISAFIRAHNYYQYFDFPGAEGTAAFGMSRVGGRYVTGTFWNAGTNLDRFHCFLLDRRTKALTQITFGVNTYNNCFGVNDKGQVLGEYMNISPDNQITEHGFFIYDNGSFTVPLPLSLGHVGGVSVVPYAMDNDGALIGLTYHNGFDNIELFLYDDGVSYSIPKPAGWVITNIGGLNNLGVFVGEAHINGETHGFRAIP